MLFFNLPLCGLKHFLAAIPILCHFIVSPLKLPFKSLHVCVHPSLQHNYIFWIIQMNNPASITKPYSFLLQTYRKTLRTTACTFLRISTTEIWEDLSHLGQF